jgi:hypothetical protein
MNLNYAIFRSEPINTLNDLAQIGSHNKRKMNYSIMLIYQIIIKNIIKIILIKMIVI